MANRELGRQGPFWQDESHDRVVRNENELNRVIQYVLDNPVKAGLVQTWEEWLWSYVR
jgi:REP element-mobilizing transposase RayT